MFVLLTLMAQCSRSQAQDLGPAPPLLLITVKLAKQLDTPAPIPFAVEFSGSCALCRVVTDPIYLAQNAREIDFGIWVPRSKAVVVRVKVNPEAIRRVLLEGTDLAFTRDANAVEFTLPAQTTDRINSAELHTHIVYRGLDVRFEHADPARRAGEYASGSFPSLQREAAANLEFAQRDAVFMLGLDSYVADQQIGTILLMGFDTNDPHGHTDYPPHMHMHMRWPQLGGTQIGHYYISDKGLLVENQVTPEGWTGEHISPFVPGEPFTTYDLHAHGVYTHTITPEGWLNLSRPGGAACRISPSYPGAGFNQGATVRCVGFEQHQISVKDDISKGVLQVQTQTGMKVTKEVYIYDPDTGILLDGNQQQRPANPPDAPAVSDSLP